MKVADYFIPYNVAALDGADSDFGSGAALLLPPSAGIPGHPNLMVAAGKAGEIYLIDRNNMGKFDPVNDNVVNAVNDGSGHLEPPNLISGSLSTPAYFNGKIYWTSGYNGPAYSYDHQLQRHHFKYVADHRHHGEPARLHRGIRQWHEQRHRLGHGRTLTRFMRTTPRPLPRSCGTATGGPAGQIVSAAW